MNHGINVAQEVLLLQRPRRQAREGPHKEHKAFVKATDINLLTLRVDNYYSIVQGKMERSEHDAEFENHILDGVLLCEYF